MAASCCGTAALLGRVGLLHAAGQPVGRAAQLPAEPPPSPTRPDVAAIDHDRILAAAERYLAQAPTPLTSLQCPRSPGTVHDYYSEAEPDTDLDAVPSAKTAPPAFTAHRDALFSLGLAVPALAAAHLLTSEQRYSEHAVVQLRAWFVDPATRMTPRLDFGSVLATQAQPETDAPAFTVQNNPSFAATPAPPEGGRFQGILEALPLVEIAQAIPFLATSAALGKADLKALYAWFAAYLRWLTEPQDTGPRLPALARDRKDHHGTSWLLQASAYASLAAPEGDVPRAEDSALAELRHRFKTVTLRAQIAADGTFSHELGSQTPYRDSLFNLDMLAGICQLLSTRFESIWDYSLEDGPGMRSAIAYHFPFIADRAAWPYRADRQHFDELPGRRASLLFTARAYQRPEYAALWKTLPPDPPDPEIQRTLPIHQPLLWVRQPPRSAA
ncbi:MAG: alginate lyase family protein [Acidobacteriaceae bacterium]